MKYTFSIFLIILSSSFLLVEGMEQYVDYRDQGSGEEQSSELPTSYRQGVEKALLKTSKKKKLKRSSSFPDLSALKYSQQSSLSATYSPAKVDTLQLKDVIDYVKQHAGQEEVIRLRQALKGKAKIKVEPLKEDEELTGFKNIRQQAEENRKKNGLGIDKIQEMCNGLGDEARNFFFDILRENTRAAHQKELVITTAQAQTVSKLARNDQIIQQTNIKAQANGNARVRAAAETAQKYIDFITRNPYIIVGIAGGVAASFFAAKHGMQILFNEIQRIVGTPRLADDTSLLTFREKIASCLGLSKKNRAAQNRELIFNPLFKNEMNQLASEISIAAKYDMEFSNCLFYGPPGTGKTLSAKTIAHNSGLHYIYFTAAKLEKLSLESALNQIQDLIDFAKWSPKKLIIIIDEAEILFADRDTTDVRSKMSTILNALLGDTGTESSNFALIALTNKPDKFDEAALDRFAVRKNFPTPSHQEIKNLLRLYSNKLIVAPPKILPTWYEKLRNKKIAQRPSVKLHNLLNDKELDRIAEKLVGYVGRDISQLVISWRNAAAVNNFQLTQRIIDSKIQQILDKKKIDHQ